MVEVSTGRSTDSIVELRLKPQLCVVIHVFWRKFAHNANDLAMTCSRKSFQFNTKEIPGGLELNL